MRTCLALMALCLLAISCATMDQNAPGAMSDSEIAAVVRAANQGEIDQGNAAVAKAASPEVKAFAQMMVTDHTNALNTANDLFGRLNITPADNDTSRTLQSNSQQTVTALGTYSGAAFDPQYMQAQVGVHQWLLNSLDTTLIPSAHRRQVRDFLQTQRSAVATHLDRARRIQSGLR